METTVKERITKFIKYNEMSQRSFERVCGLSNGYIGNMRVSIQPDKVTEISKKFPQLNTGWLMTGEGEMLKNNAGSITHDLGNTNFRLVPMLNLDARGGFDANAEIDCPQYTNELVPFKGAQDGDASMPVIGNSMYPIYPPGSCLLIRPLPMWREFIEYGASYVIELVDFRRLVKIIKRSDEDPIMQFKLVSFNSEYEPVEIPKEMIRRIYAVKAAYRPEMM